VATDQRALGAIFDVGTITVPTDAVAGAITGGRTRLRDATGVSFVVVATGASTDVLDLDLQEHNALTGGTSQDLDVASYFFYKSATTLDGSEVWTRGTAAPSNPGSELTDIGAASQQTLVVVEVRADQLSDGFGYVSLNVPDLGTNGTKHVAIVPILWGLKVQRYPTSLLAPRT
jgi:hypothetical protein